MQDCSKLTKKNINKIDIYYIGYVTINKIGDYNNIISINPLYLMIDETIGHFDCNSIEEKNENKYSVFLMHFSNYKNVTILKN